MGGTRGEQCFLCAAAAGEKQHSTLVLALLPDALAMLNAFPYSPGHVLISPRRHLAELTDVSEAEAAQMLRLLRMSVDAETALMSPAGFNVGLNLGRVAGAGVADHLHLHLVPRWEGDTNFMPVTADTRVISQALEDTAAALKPMLAERLAGDRA